MKTYETLNQKQRDDIHAAIAEAARKILVDYCGPRGGNEYADHDDYLIEQVWMTADTIADAVDYHRRRECAISISEDLRLSYSDDHIEDLVDLLAQHWDDARDVRDMIDRHDLPHKYDWLYNTRPIK